uniref:Protein unc-13 D n=1 Tax=Lygus hesperus TaxID=30085 RepID=A0A0A9YAH0_LYGHE
MEEEIWKKYVRSMSEEAGTTLDLRVQEIDNGWFERFGTILKDRNEEEISKICAPETGEALKAPEDEVPEIETEETKGIISDVVGLNIEELYRVVLYEIIHTIGADADNNDRESLFQYLQDAFKMDDEKHSEALAEVREKEAPSILLNVEVIQAKELYPKDANGLSDPFVTLYLNRNSSHRYNTSVKTETLNPCWEEYFSLPAEDTSEDSLVVEVWDFDPAETVSDKIGKLTGVKGVRGLRKLMKEIAVTASTGKHDNELIGVITIPLKSIPSSGHVKWFSLEKKSSRTTKRGAIQLKLGFSSEKNNQVAAQEHRHLMRLIVLQEMEHNKPDLQTWDGSFEGPADVILRQHAAQSGLRPADEKMAQWVEFGRLHANQPLNFKLFSSIIYSVTDPLNNGLYSDDEMKLFWDGTKRLLPSIFQGIRKLRKTYTPDKSCLIQLDAMLSILAELSKLEVADNIDLFPSSIYGWLQNGDKNTPTILECLDDAIKQSASEWFVQLVESTRPSEVTSENLLQHAVKITQQVRGDLQRSIEHFDKIFYTRLKVQYAMISYRIYDEKIAELVEPLVTEVCSTMKQLKFKGNTPDIENADVDPLTMGTSLFELYLALQRCLMLGQGLFPVGNDDFKLSRYHVWFHKGVRHWLDMAVFKATQRIAKAVELDNLTPVDSITKFSSSPVDTRSIFHQIKLFWNQLAWPDVENSYTFVAKIMDDICRCSVFYADRMAAKVASLGDVENSFGKTFIITNEWCLAVNNIDHVRQSIQPFTHELGVDIIVKNLSEVSNAAQADHCRETLTRLVENSVDTVQNKIIELMETMAMKMSPSIKRFLLEGAEIINQDNNHLDRLMSYLEENVGTLYSQLSDENFARILAILWENVYNILSETVADGLDRRRPPVFFENLNTTLDLLVSFFKQKETVEGNESYKKIKTDIQLHGMPTDQLILTYYLERMSEQTALNNPSYGMMTVKMQLIPAHSLLRIEILNCRNLLPTDSNGSCDPYVKIQLLPEEKFNGVVKPRTKIHKKTLFPLFDETFQIQLSKEQSELKSALVHFVVKDQDFLGMSSQFVAESFIPLSDIPITTMETSIHEMKQVHLQLTKPTSFDSDVFLAIEHRNGEKLARDFIKRQKAKVHLNNNGKH